MQREGRKLKNVPFYSQKVNWQGEDSGFPNREEVERWENNCCGIACLRMVIDTVAGQKPSYWDLLQLGLAKKAYIEAGWIHRGLVDMAKEFGVPGAAYRGQSVNDLRAAIGQGNLCIVSASAGFRGGLINKTTGIPYPKGGHLIVAYATTADTIVCHHPSSWDEWNKIAWSVPTEKWVDSFTGNFMAFPAPPGD